MAGWEEAQAIVVSWARQYAPILREIVRYSVDECTVIIVTSDSLAVARQLQKENISLERVEFIQAPYNSVWVRDYGPSSIYYKDVDSLMLASWAYNRSWRPNDGLVPALLAKHLKLPLYEARDGPYKWIHAGGNNLCDGMGTNFSSSLVLEENPEKGQEQLDAIAAKFLGVSRYVKFPILAYDLIHHLDMHMQLLDEETIVVGRYPEGIADGPQIEANIEYLLREVPTAFGNAYRVVRVPMPPGPNGNFPDTGGHYRTYTNFIMVNKTVMVPAYEKRYDTTALRIFREALPGYRVVGINCNNIIDEFGALHCITKLVGANHPLWIAHARLRDAKPGPGGYPATAIFKHRSGIAEARLYYRTDRNSPYQAIPMLLLDEERPLWGASIPPQEEGTEIHYYIYARAHSGKEQWRPLAAPEGYFRFRAGPAASVR